MLILASSFIADENLTERLGRHGKLQYIRPPGGCRGLARRGGGAENGGGHRLVDLRPMGDNAVSMQREIETETSSMRLSEEKIKAGILHPDKDVREMVIRYFAESSIVDDTVMPLVIQAVEKYGRTEAFLGSVIGDGLTLNDETLRWVIDELKRQSDTDELDGHLALYECGLCDLLDECDADLVARHHAAIAEITKLSDDQQEYIAERVRLVSDGPDDCVRQLEDCFPADESGDYYHEIGWPSACRLAEAAARGGAENADRVLQIIRREAGDDYNEDQPLSWLRPAAMRFAGEMKLDDAVPLLLTRLFESEGEADAEEADLALRMIGNDRVVDAARESYDSADWIGRLGVTGILARIHTDRAASACLELFEQEEDRELKAFLGKALLGQFTHEGIEPVRQALIENACDLGAADLRGSLVAACTLMEVELPEMQQLREEVAEDRRRRIEEMKELSEAFTQFTRRSRADTDDEDYLDDEADLDIEPRYGLDEQQSAPPEPIVSQPHVGRNAPCPCGSGKKYKKCCLKKQRNDSLHG